jgi:Tfp pilus assembly protein PilF
MIFRIKSFLFLSLFFILISPVVQGQDFSTKSKKAIKLFVTGQNSYRTEKYGEAEASFMEAIEKDPGFVEAYLTLAQMYEETGRDTSAISYYKRHLILIPGNILRLSFMLPNWNLETGFTKMLWLIIPNT